MKFSELNLHTSLNEAIESQKFVDCTPIQEIIIPHVLHGQDVAGLAQTGTGKTAAYLLPLMERILQSREKAHEANGEVSGEAKTEVSGQNESPSPSLTPFPNWKASEYILVLVPTRELAEQVFENCNLFGKFANMQSVAIYGGTSYEPQKKALSAGVQFVIATPGRLIDLYKEHVIDLKQVRAIVFDEADRMFDMGFKEDAKYVLRRIPDHRQFLVFSATLNFDVLNMAYQFGSNPIEVNVSKDRPKADQVTDVIFHVGQSEKPQYLLSLLKKHAPQQAIIFNNFKSRVERLAVFLTRNNIPAMGISSLLTQAHRNRVMEQFKSENNQNILVATDVAARGLDIKNVDMVINMDLPEDPENYVHRIGRTGRAGAKGVAFSLVSDRDVISLGRIEEYLGHKVTVNWVEDNELFTEFKPYPKESEVTPPRIQSFSSGNPTSRKKTRGRPRSSSPTSTGGRGRKSFRSSASAHSATSTTSTKNSAPSSSIQDMQNMSEKSTSTHRDRRMGRHKKNEKVSTSSSSSSSALNSNFKERKTEEAKNQRRNSNNDSSSKKISSTLKSKEAQNSSQGKKKTTKKRKKVYSYRSQNKKYSHQLSSQNSSSKSSQPIGQKVSGWVKKLFS